MSVGAFNVFTVSVEVTGSLFPLQKLELYRMNGANCVERVEVLLPYYGNSFRNSC